MVLDSELMGNLLRDARKSASYDPAGAQRDYVAVRSYVITHPWTTSEKLRKELLQGLLHLPRQKVGELYQDSDSDIVSFSKGALFRD